MDDAERLALGREAEMLLGNQAFQAALKNLRAKALAEFPNTADGDTAAWGLLHQKLQVMTGLESELKAILTNGTAALYAIKRRQG